MRNFKFDNLGEYVNFMKNLKFDKYLIQLKAVELLKPVVSYGNFAGGEIFYIPEKILNLDKPDTKIKLTNPVYFKSNLFKKPDKVYNISDKTAFFDFKSTSNVFLNNLFQLVLNRYYPQNHYNNNCNDIFDYDNYEIEKITFYKPPYVLNETTLKNIKYIFSAIFENLHLYIEINDFSFDFSNNNHITYFINFDSMTEYKWYFKNKKNYLFDLKIKIFDGINNKFIFNLIIVLPLKIKIKRKDGKIITIKTDLLLNDKFEIYLKLNYDLLLLIELANNLKIAQQKLKYETKGDIIYDSLVKSYYDSYNIFKIFTLIFITPVLQKIKKNKKVDYNEFKNAIENIKLIFEKIYGYYNIFEFMKAYVKILDNRYINKSIKDINKILIILYLLDNDFDVEKLKILNHFKDQFSNYNVDLESIYYLIIDKYVDHKIYKKLFINDNKNIIKYGKFVINVNDKNLLNNFAKLYNHIRFLKLNYHIDKTTLSDIRGYVYNNKGFDVFLAMKNI